MKPRFIVIDGPDGAGKSVQARLVAQALGADHEAEPTEAPPGKLARAVMRGQERVEDVRARQLLFAADRVEHTRTIRRLLETTSVVCDRYVASSLAYGAADMAMATQNSVVATMDMALWTHQINRWALAPDVTVILDMPFEVCAARIRARASRDLYDAERFQRLIHALYDRAECLLPHHAVVHVNAEGAEREVTARILEAINRPFTRRDISDQRHDDMVSVAVVKAIASVAQ